MQSTFLCLGKFLKGLADDQSSSITKGSIYYIKHLQIQPFSMEVDWQESWCLMEVSTMLYIFRYCVFPWWGRYCRHTCLAMQRKITPRLVYWWVQRALTLMLCMANPLCMTGLVTLFLIGWYQETFKYLSNYDRLWWFCIWFCIWNLIADNFSYTFFDWSNEWESPPFDQLAGSSHGVN